MIPRDLAATLAGSVFDHVERERTMVRHSIEDVLYDGLLLGLAKQAAAPAPMAGGAASQEVTDAAKKLCKLIIGDMSLNRGISPVLMGQIDNLYLALLRTGWQP